VGGNDTKTGRELIRDGRKARLAGKIDCLKIEKKVFKGNKKEHWWEGEKE